MSLQSVIVAIRVNLLYGAELRHFHEFLLMTAERGNWLSVRVTGTPGSKLEIRAANQGSELLRTETHTGKMSSPAITRSNSSSLSSTSWATSSLSSELAAGVAKNHCNPHVFFKFRSTTEMSQGFLSYRLLPRAILWGGLGVYPRCQ